MHKFSIGQKSDWFRVNLALHSYLVLLQRLEFSGGGFIL